MCQVAGGVPKATIAAGQRGRVSDRAWGLEVQEITLLPCVGPVQCVDMLIEVSLVMTDLFVVVLPFVASTVSLLNVSSV